MFGKSLIALAIVAASIPASGQSKTDIARLDFTKIDMGGFTLSQKYPPTQANGVISRIVDYRNEEIQATLTIETVEMQTAQARERVIRETLTPPAGRLPAHGHSRLPLGEQSGHSGSPEQGGLIQSAFIGNVGVIVTLNYSAEKQGAGHKVQTADPQGDTAMVEGLARLVLARMVGEKMRPAPQKTGRSAAFRALTTAKGAPALSLSEWAATNGFQVRQDQRLGKMTLTKSGKTLVFMLGANEVQVNGKWASLSDFVACRGEDWYVPQSDLARLLR